MNNLDELCEFLVEAKKSGYASGNAAKKTVEKDQSTTLVFEKGDWKYHDNYFGGEPYGGREVVFFKNSPIYMMVYYGWVDDRVSDIESVYTILQSALLLIPEDNPFRGPKTYRLHDIEYNNEFEGEINKFFGEETIKSANGVELYRAKYMGGLIDQR